MLGSLGNHDGDGYENVTAEISVLALFQTSSRLFRLVQFVECRRIFLELNSKGLYQSSGEEKEGRCLVFTCSTKREISQFQVVIVQRWQKKYKTLNSSQIDELGNWCLKG